MANEPRHRYALPDTSPIIDRGPDNWPIVWLVFYTGGGGGSDPWIEHVASTEEAADRWIATAPLLEQRYLVTVPRYVDQHGPIEVP